MNSVQLRGVPMNESWTGAFDWKTHCVPRLGRTNAGWHPEKLLVILDCDTSLAQTRCMMVGKVQALEPGLCKTPKWRFWLLRKEWHA